MANKQTPIQDLISRSFSLTKEEKKKLLEQLDDLSEAKVSALRAVLENEQASLQNLDQMRLDAVGKFLQNLKTIAANLQA